ncbi:hypothetical protein LCGC14_1839970 [marine sediment metagenome]|uniref:TIR domain-containing protein n=1 Tax=marine sediment metagenome TaxID=412755 RepID=A0A0F9ISZ2_9ZZZZ
MKNNKDLLDIMLQNYMQKVGKDLLAALIIDSESKIIGSSPKNSDILSKDKIFEILNKFIISKYKNHDKLSKTNSKGFRNIIIDTDQFRLILCEFKPKYVFVNILNALDSVDYIFPYFFLCAEKIKQLFEGTLISPTLPSLYVDNKNQTEYINRRREITSGLIRDHDIYKLKLIMCGDEGVGKTSIITRFVTGSFSQNLSATIGVNHKLYDYNIKNYVFRFYIWDLAGERYFRKLRHTYCRGSDVGMLVYDVTRWESFINIKRWYKDVMNAAPEVILILVGNKVDLESERKVPRIEADEFARNLGLLYLETSALNGLNIEEAFGLLGIQILLEKKKIDIEGLNDHYIKPRIRKVFLCHSSNDKYFVKNLAKSLIGRDLKVWYDEWEMKVGDSLKLKIQTGIKESSYLGIILSPDSVNSPWVNFELNSALIKELKEKKVFILPILFKDCEIPDSLKGKLYADFRKSYAEGIETLLERF